MWVITNKIRGGITMQIKTWRDPYEAGFSPTKPKEIELNPGLTVLVGCNGAGKSTLLSNIQEVCNQNKTPCISYDNLRDGGSGVISDLLFSQDYDEASYLLSASEGESIKANVGRKAKSFQEFIENGFVKDRSYHFMKMFSDNIEDEKIECKDRVFLFDAVDSGLSVDSIVEVKALFQQILNDYKDSDKQLYIIIAANEYELARNADCFDVNAGKYLRFKDYEEYRNFIIDSRKRKEKRITQQIKWSEKQKQKEIEKYYEVVEKQQKELDKIRQRKESGKIVSTWRESDVNDMVKDYLRQCRFISKEDIDSLGSS